MKKIVVMGLGYVGLPMALLLARCNKVIGVDINAKLLKQLKAREIFIAEDDVREAFDSPIVRKNFHVQATLEEADVFIIAAPTPINASKTADLSHVKSTTEAIAPYLRKGNLVILESTAPPLTCRTVLKPMIEGMTRFKVPQDILLAHCPERVLLGNTIFELTHNCRIIGGIDPNSAELAQEIYRSLVKGEMFLTDDVTAEFCKVIENAYRDVNIAFANEISMIAAGINVDINEAIFLANKHPRVLIHQPGIGVGGHCIPIDPWFITQIDKEHSTLIQTARMINDAMPAVTAHKVRDSVSGIHHPRIVAVGMAYKPNTADMRESPSLEVVRILREDGYDVLSFDPLVADKSYDSLARAVNGADCLVILVEHDVVIKELESNLDNIKAAMRTPIILRF